jgi:hypothetical protein
MERLQTASKDLRENLRMGQHRFIVSTSYISYAFPLCLIGDLMKFLSVMPVKILAADMNVPSSGPLFLFGKYKVSNSCYGIMGLHGHAFGN